MFYEEIKFIHILSASVIFTSMFVCAWYWFMQLPYYHGRILRLSLCVLLPFSLFQLITGWVLISQNHVVFSLTWIEMTNASFLIFILGWLIFLFFLLAPASQRNIRGLKGVCLILAFVALFTMVFIMTNKML